MKTISLKKMKSYALDFLFFILGSAIYAASVNIFTAPNNIAPGGLTGIGTMLNYLFDLPIGTMILALNIPLFILGLLFYGKRLDVYKRQAYDGRMSYSLHLMEALETMSCRY